MLADYLYNLHTHSLLSDGALLPSEIAARYLAKGYKAIAITDHADYSNIDFIIDSILRFTNNWPKDSLIKVLPGVELTHIPPQQIGLLASHARKQGIKVTIAHGQTPVEPVVSGTNRAALEADIDILAHPGRISEEDVLLAKKNGIFLEITSRRGHCNTNKHVAKLALKLGAKLILSHDSHAPEDIISPKQMFDLALRCGLDKGHIDKIIQDVEEFLLKKGGA